VFCQLLSILSIKFAPQTYKGQFHTISNSSGRGINANTNAVSEFSDNFILHLQTHHYIRKRFIDRLIKPENCYVETEWLIDKSALSDGNK
jgi:hypothetical protein